MAKIEIPDEIFYSFVELLEIARYGIDDAHDREDLHPDEIRVLELVDRIIEEHERDKNRLLETEDRYDGFDCE